MGKENREKPWDLMGDEDVISSFVRDVEEQAKADPTGEALRKLEQYRIKYSNVSERIRKGWTDDLAMEVTELDGRTTITITPESGKPN